MGAGPVTGRVTRRRVRKKAIRRKREARQAAKVALTGCCVRAYAGWHERARI
jgi:hypothetical protein